MKKIQRVPKAAVSLSIIEERKIYSQKFLELCTSTKTLIFLDETGFQVCTFYV